MVGAATAVMRAGFVNCCAATTRGAAARTPKAATMNDVLGQCERHISISRSCSEFSAAGGNHHVLLSTYSECTRRRVSRRRQRRLPEEPARRLVECPEFGIHRCSNEHQAARGHDRTTVLLCARRLAEWNSPDVVARVEIDRTQGAPGRLDRGESARVAPLLVPGELVHRRRWPGDPRFNATWSCPTPGVPPEQVGSHRAFILLGKRRE